MTNKIKPYEGKLFILKKSGMLHEVSEATGKRLKDSINVQTGHQFYTITELDITINSSEIEGIYTHEQYEEICNVKQGMWKCAYGTWHEASRNKVCRCAQIKREEIEKQRQRMEEKRQEKYNTPEAREAAYEIMQRTYQEKALEGRQLFTRMYAKGNKDGRKIMRSFVDQYEKNNQPVPQSIINTLEIHDDVTEALNKTIQNDF